MILLPKNLTFYWMVFTFLGVWFLFLFTPAVLKYKKNFLNDLPFLLHLLGAYILYVICMINTLFTPSTMNGKSKPYHVVFGRVALVAGFLGFCMGGYCSWWPFRNNLPPKSFAIGITIGGFFQLWFQYQGYHAIKIYQKLQNEITTIDSSSNATTSVHKPSNNEEETETIPQRLEALKEKRDKALQQHIHNMIALFVIGCGAPALMRVMLIVLGGDSLNASLIVAITILLFSVRPFANSYIRTQNEDFNGMITPLIDTSEDTSTY